jgi:hypothetical protein
LIWEFVALDGYYESLGKRWGTNNSFNDKNIALIYICEDFRTKEKGLYFAVFAYQRLLM